jgi:hypothetical protein
LLAIEGCGLATSGDRESLCQCVPPAHPREEDS